jgi:hypothetical protein
MLTIGILNCHRQANVVKLVKRYSAMPLVSRITVWSSPPGDFRITDNPKVLTATCAPDWGMYARFQSVLNAPTEWIMTVDDDLFVPEESIKTMLDARMKDKDKMVSGMFGRRPSRTQEFAVFHDIEDTVCEIVVGRVMVFHVSLISRFFDVVRNPKWEELYAQGRQAGWSKTTNIEDIIMSYVAMQTAPGRLNQIHKLGCQELDAPFPVWTMRNFFKYRQAGMTFTQQFFNNWSHSEHPTGYGLRR